jgi:hypothetical protein
METKIYSKHTVTDGKWEIVVHVYEEPDHLEIVDIRQNLRAMLDKLYNSDGVTIAKSILDEVMDARKVEVAALYGPVIVGIKEA